MNLALSIALYASLCKAQGLPLRFPGSEQAWHSIVDHTDAGLLAGATVGRRVTCGTESGVQREQWRYLALERAVAAHRTLV
jgi:hypothetical protein